ncbi:indolepyruvate ferredoxin oxidoreductase family protein [Sneathiella chungangensis]|uniref:Indolepyruvate ferredoxin oxidoreductase family protein n=1 Tax=Sneathiella chungangensis TaxID=1418234 RepID=A0A845MGQ9_9PROT|nr:indolepyruvate ferredoxin oxidoreductase family protein [Sneathiella chungangensis]MZR22224.1 indolepyruvate ferredoxin oxidoreductase family protein [Sneathiella chungangensis]
MQLANVTLDDKYTLEEGRIFLTGIQALVRLPLMQKERDRAAGLNTAGFISGYRGSPLAGYDQSLWKANKILKENDIHFEPGVNEDLAATAVWGSQQLNMFKGARYDGVFGLWYGKGPGVDRSGDVFRHANSAGTSKYGGVLALAGDDHGIVSSSIAHQSEHSFAGWMMPVLHPANVQEILDYGLLGIEMSRFSGLWIGFKCISETVEGGASVYVAPDRGNFIRPNIEMPEGGLNIQPHDNRFDQEVRLNKHKVYAARAFARANNIDHITMDSPKRRFGIVTVGKSYYDVRQALRDLGINDELAADIGLTVYKVGMPWPLEPDGIRQFAEGLEEVLVIEEKRAVIENQMKEQLYNWDTKVRPRILGKFDEDKKPLQPSTGEMTPAMVARVIAGRIRRFYTSESIENRLAFLDRKEKQLEAKPAKLVRTPFYCSGCPHNTSTVVPEGSRAVAGIGCHFMVTWMNRNTDTFTQMGGEGVPWIGQMHFTDEKHIFANLGDGTYYHSGILAIRQAVAAKANITYKILYNDAVAMTGGQPTEGHITPWQIAQQLEGEGVSVIRVVTDEPEKYAEGTPWPKGTTIHHRDDLDKIQRHLREEKGVSILIYDQTCAAEKRRRRKRGTFPDPAKRVIINDLVCEGCGDCSVKSNCLSVEPIETEFGRKRTINQSTCNKDYSCVNGFCPSFVTIEGGELRKAAPHAAENPAEGIPAPAMRELKGPYRILITGIGGTGVVTIGAIVGMAAHLEGKGISVLDQAGLAQKGGAVTSHVHIAPAPEDINAVRIPAGRADLLIGCDMVVSGSYDSLAKFDVNVAHAVINAHPSPTMDFTLDPDAPFPVKDTLDHIREAIGPDQCDLIEASEIATTLLGDSIATNLFMLGFAYQKGLIPLTEEALLRAVELNGVAVPFNKKAFGWGRVMAADPDRVMKEVTELKGPALRMQPTEDLEEMISRRIEFLTQYQNARYAKRYSDLIARVRTRESEVMPGTTSLSEAVVRSYFKLLAYKDEYEVARLYTDTTFMQRVERMMDGEYELKFHLAPPLFSKRDPDTGELKKKEYGQYMMKAFGFLAKFKSLRGTPLDIFGYQEERKTERALIKEFEGIIDELLSGLTTANHAIAVEIAALPQHIRGYGHVKDKAIKVYRGDLENLLTSYKSPEPKKQAAE